MREIIFEVRPDEADGGLTATALGYDIFTDGSNAAELRTMVTDAVRCHFFDSPIEDRPTVIRLHFVHDEVLAV